MSLEDEYNSYVGSQYYCNDNVSIILFYKINIRIITKKNENPQEYAKNFVQYLINKSHYLGLP